MFPFVWDTNIPAILLFDLQNCGKVSPVSISFGQSTHLIEMERSRLVHSKRVKLSFYFIFWQFYPPKTTNQFVLYSLGVSEFHKCSIRFTVWIANNANIKLLEIRIRLFDLVNYRVKIVNPNIISQLEPLICFYE